MTEFRDANRRTDLKSIPAAALGRRLVAATSTAQGYSSTAFHSGAAILGGMIAVRQRQLRNVFGSGLGPQRTPFVVMGVVGVLVLALLGLPTVSATVGGPGISDGAKLAQQCDSTPLAFVPVVGQSELAREDHAMEFSGANKVVLAVDSAIAGYPVAESHAMLFAGADAEPLEVDSSIAGYPVAEAHAKLFAGTGTERLEVNSAIAGYPVAEVHAMLFTGANEEIPTVGSVFYGC